MDQYAINLKEALEENNEMYLYQDILKLLPDAEDYPPFMFVWKRVREFIQAIEEARRGGKSSTPEPPFSLPSPMTEKKF
jgi:hypothetical protein